MAIDPIRRRHWTISELAARRRPGSIGHGPRLAGSGTYGIIACMRHQQRESECVPIWRIAGLRGIHPPRPAAGETAAPPSLAARTSVSVSRWAGRAAPVVIVCSDLKMLLLPLIRSKLFLL